eukprot:750596-Hanusia_phi.AAC.4
MVMQLSSPTQSPGTFRNDRTRAQACHRAILQRNNTQILLDANHRGSDFKEWMSEFHVVSTACQHCSAPVCIECDFIGMRSCNQTQGLQQSVHHPFPNCSPVLGSSSPSRSVFFE